MALPFTEPVAGEPPTGDQAWTCFLSAANFKGPIAYYIPETWSKIGKLFNYPFIYGRGLDARPGIMGGGAMEINTVPCFRGHGRPGRRLFEAAQAAVPGGRPGTDPSGPGRDVLLEGGALRCLQGLAGRRPDLFRAVRRERRLEDRTLTTRDDRASTRPGRRSAASKESSTPGFSRPTSGDWSGSTGRMSAMGCFPQYFKHAGDERVAVSVGGRARRRPGFRPRNSSGPRRGEPYTSPAGGAWGQPGPVRGPFQVKLADGSIVTYSWYRFVDQPSFQQ